MTFRSAVVELAFVAAIVLSTTASNAQPSREGFAINRFEPAERGNPWFVLDALDFRRPAAFGATLDYTYKQLVIEDPQGNEPFALVRHQTFLHTGGTIAIANRLRLGVDIPLAIYQDGESGPIDNQNFKSTSKPALGDIRFGIDLRLVQFLAVGLRVWWPSGVASQFAGDGTIRIGPHLMASGDIGQTPFSWAARVALIYREHSDYAGGEVGSEVTAAVGAGVHLLERHLFIGPELWASSAFARFFGLRESPADIALGAHYTIGSIRFGVGAGTGLTQGFGAPRARGLLSIEFAPPAPPIVKDRDHDGILDDDDACPDTPGVHDSDPTSNGCPAQAPLEHEDSDHDSIWDTDDACPTVAGVRTQDPMTNGCPPSSPRQLAVVTKTEIRIGEQIRFATDSADLLDDSNPVLAAIKKVLDDRPDVRKIRIEGHTDNVGDPTYNDDLSSRRAASVTAWLVSHGIDPKRLESQGFGSKKPIDSNETDTGRANNRRVVFTIIERADARPR